MIKLFEWIEKLKANGFKMVHLMPLKRGWKNLMKSNATHKGKPFLEQKTMTPMGTKSEEWE